LHLLGESRFSGADFLVMAIRIALGSDHLGRALKDEIAALLRERQVEFQDFGVAAGQTADYPDVAEKVAGAIQEGLFERGILICGTGIGMAISANKVPGIRAAVVHDPYSAERSRKSNNVQVLAMGALVIGTQLARQLVSIWLESEFQGGDSARKVEKIGNIEARQVGKLLQGAGAKR
jgi:ribose 5-phosphate isomerase B